MLSVAHAAFWRLLRWTTPQLSSLVLVLNYWTVCCEPLKSGYGSTLARFYLAPFVQLPWGFRGNMVGLTMVHGNLIDLPLMAATFAWE